VNGYFRRVTVSCQFEPLRTVCCLEAGGGGGGRRGKLKLIIIQHVEYAGGRIQYGILFIFRLFYEYSNLECECVHSHVICRVHQAEYLVHVLVAASQKYVNTCSTRRPIIQGGAL